MCVSAASLRLRWRRSSAPVQRSSSALRLGGFGRRHVKVGDRTLLVSFLIGNDYITSETFRIDGTLRFGPR
jgi:hypothetical protein